MARQQQRDEAFEATFRALFPRAYGLAYRILGDRGAAEDAAAEAMARLYADWESLRTAPHRDGWVLRVAANLAIDTIRKGRRRRGWKREDTGKPVTTTEPRDLEDRSSHFDDDVTMRAVLGAALQSLPRRQREIVTLRILAGFSESETADSLGISTGSVKTHMHRGLRSLRVQLDQQDREVTSLGA
ncbi:MAG: SigE family RNA polymerase sigma factor [Actinomycetota bacterium]